MAQKKQPYNWGKVKPGDIISFKYNSKSSDKSSRTQSILVLNPKLQVKLKDGTQTKHLIGIKIEESNAINLKLTSKVISLLEKIGEFKTLDEKNKLYKLEIDPRFIVNEIKGVKPSVYNLIGKGELKKQYRTYEYDVVKISAVYLEPIRLDIKAIPPPLITDKTKKPKQEIIDKTEKIVNDED